MIHRISIENFFSIRDKQTLDLQIAVNAPDLFNFRVSLSKPEIRLPSVVALFGPNASGKSTVLRAITTTIAFALYSFRLPPNETLRDFQSFRSEAAWNSPTKISIDFDASWLREASTLFRYELHLDQAGPWTGAQRVLYEAMHFAPEGKMRRVFERRGDKITVGKDFDIGANDVRLKSVRPNCSVISTLAQLNHRVAYLIWQDLSSLQSNLWGLSQVETGVKDLLHYYTEDAELTKGLNRELRRLDTGLDRMIIEKGPEGLFAKFVHDGLDEPILMVEESTGTQRFIGIFPRLHYVLKTGHIAVIDELDSDLHPLLIPELLRWFHDPKRNPHNAQLWLTVHNAAVMDELEKEEIFLCEKDLYGGTRIYGAQQIEGLRREPSLARKYLGGVLGAVPHIG